MALPKPPNGQRIFAVMVELIKCVRSARQPGGLLPPVTDEALVSALCGAIGWVISKGRYTEAQQDAILVVLEHNVRKHIKNGAGKIL